jgi:aerobic carbon-monoxide dehydrogenase medium subunit
MIPTAFEYRRAESLADALAQLHDSNGEAKLIAGGHTLIPLMKLRLSEPSMLIDVSRVAELHGIREEGEFIEIGGTTTHTEVESSGLLKGKVPILPSAAAEIGDPQVRNRGTIGGSLAHADPAADLPAVMLALDASMELRSAGGQRSVNAAGFFQDLFTVDLNGDEAIVSVRFAPVRTAAYAKLHQRASHFALVGVAAALAIKDGSIVSARVGLTGATTHAVRLPEVEEALAGKPANVESIDAAASSAGSSVGDINGDIHGSEDYRRAMIKVFTRRALEAAAAKA